MEEDSQTIICDHVVKGAFYICNESITNDSRRVLSLGLKKEMKESPMLNHFYCFNCKQKCSYKWRMPISVISTRGDIYIPNMNCDDLIKWVPEPK